ncbi:Golgi phosphoprotein 3-like protein (GPP34) [Desulfitobacterium dehalogenans ATCC 51507]|uniref:Golgi phosphoprotein 3-like protein (GPP34) n=1 Tax=Desulfitobacterium dehalogenans (strain ATCC 51507 / DSM 9161 / JW/IU-DC1) TaxID=756499 RepID=I4A568_DESDJ|nr:GPP34 family phosphoprotein [Desulfitobacterium dehalogenans]AFL99102.1 Golgi phosphoprotein 3-like protein (GPP34) [Desulfitobacterium dehalogenans ATCC 51507]
MLTLMEEVLLISLNEEKGNFSFTASTCIDYCLTGAILMELEHLKRIRVDKKTVEVSDARPLNNRRLELALHQMDSSKRHRPPDYWISRLRSTLKGLRKGILEEMADKALLREEEQQTFIFFSSTRYPVRDERARKDILDRIHRVLLRREDPDRQTAKLIGLLYAGGILPYLVDKGDRKEAKKRAKEVTKDDILANAVKKAVQATYSNPAFY